MKFWMVNLTKRRTFLRMRSHIQIYRSFATVHTRTMYAATRTDPTQLWGSFRSSTYDKSTPE